MRTLILMAWLLVPLAAVAYHYGPGQRQLCVDDVGRLLKQAQSLAEAGHQPEAIAAYRQALDLMPDELLPQQRRARLEMARLQMTSQMLPEAYLELIALVDELRENPDPDPKFMRDADAALANGPVLSDLAATPGGGPRATSGNLRSKRPGRLFASWRKMPKRAAAGRKVSHRLPPRERRRRNARAMFHPLPSRTRKTPPGATAKTWRPQSGWREWTWTSFRASPCLASAVDAARGPAKGKGRASARNRVRAKAGKKRKTPVARVRDRRPTTPDRSKTVRTTFVEDRHRQQQTKSPEWLMKSPLTAPAGRGDLLFHPRIRHGCPAVGSSEACVPAHERFDEGRAAR